MNEEDVEAPRKSSKVMISESSADTAVPRPRGTKTFKKSLLKSTNGGNADKPAEEILDVKLTDAESPSPISENLVEEEATKSTSEATSDQMRKDDDANEQRKENAQQRQKGDADTSGEEQTKEEKEETRTKSEHQPEDVEGNAGDNLEGEVSQMSEGNEDDKQKEEESNVKERELEPMQTTQLRGRSKATGRIMGGWI